MSAKLNQKIIEDAFKAMSSWWDREAFNCWGFTAAHFGWIADIEWVDRDTMINLLSRNTKPVESIEVGDIEAYYDDLGELIHTAVYAGDGLYYHKEGQRCFHHEEQKSIYKRYPEITKTVVMRLKAVT